MTELEEVFEGVKANSFFRPFTTSLQYINPAEVDENFSIIFCPDEMLKYLEERCDEDITDNYSYNVCSMCNNAVAWCLLRMRQYMYGLDRDVQIIEGKFGAFEHTWLLWDDKYFIDLTLAQFIKEDTPKLAITDKMHSMGRDAYTILDVYNIAEWLDIIK